MDTPTLVDFGYEAVASLHTDTSVPVLQLWATEGDRATRARLKGRERLVTLARAILAALNEAPAEQAPSQAAKELITTREQLIVAEDRIASLEGALNLAGRQMEEAQLEAKRLRDVLGEQAEAAARPRRPRKQAPPVVDATIPRDPEPHLTDEGLAETGAIIDAMPEEPVAGATPPPAFPADWLRLPEPQMEVGEAVVALVADASEPGGWRQVEGEVMQVFADAHKATVRLGDRPPCVIDIDKLKVRPVPAPAPVVPADETVVDRLLNTSERRELAALAKASGYGPDRMVAMMQRLFNKSTSAELTVTEFDTLRDRVAAEQKIPF